MEDSTLHDSKWSQCHVDLVTTGHPVDFDVFVRTLGPGIGVQGRQSAVVGRVEGVDRRDAVDAARLWVWGDRLCVSECCASNPAVGAIRETVERLGQWVVERLGQWAAERTDVSIGFERNAVRSSVIDEHREVVDLPTICPAVSVDDELAGVYPATVDEERLTVAEYLEWFERARAGRVERALADVSAGQ